MGRAGGTIATADQGGQVAGFVSCVVIVISDIGGAVVPAAGA